MDIIWLAKWAWAKLNKHQFCMEIVWFVKWAWAKLNKTVHSVHISSAVFTVAVHLDCRLVAIHLYCRTWC